jgi:hypothetical protein
LLFLLASWRAKYTRARKNTRAKLTSTQEKKVPYRTMLPTGRKASTPTFCVLKHARSSTVSNCGVLWHVRCVRVSRVLWLWSWPVDLLGAHTSSTLAFCGQPTFLSVCKG